MASGIDDDLVVLAYDGSERAKASIREAARQLGSGRRAIALTVWQPMAAVPFAGTAIVPPPTTEEEATELAGEGATLARSAGFDARPLVERGDPVWRVIVDAADAQDAGIVVLGSHGRSGIGLVLLGSVATAVAQHTDLSVLIVHTPSDDRAA
jgi:nucleotide-binding universal stress UspA family protein